MAAVVSVCRIRESLNLFLNRFHMFKVNLFAHGAGRRLDQRIRRLLAMVSLLSQRSVRPGETTARRVSVQLPSIHIGPNFKLRDSFAITQVYCIDMLSALITCCTVNMNLFHQGLLYHNRGSLSPTSTYKFSRLISIYLFIHLKNQLRGFLKEKTSKHFPLGFHFINCHSLSSYLCVVIISLKC